MPPLPEVIDNASVPPSLPDRIDQARNKALFTSVFRERFDANAVRQLYETNRRWALGSPEGIQIPQSELQALVSELDGTLGKYKSPSSGSIGNMLYFLALQQNRWARLCSGKFPSEWYKASSQDL